LQPQAAKTSIIEQRLEHPTVMSFSAQCYIVAEPGNRLC